MKHDGDAAAARAALLKEGFGCPRIPWITSRQLAEGSYKATFLIDQVLVAKQSDVFGGPSKGMKTTLAIEMAVDLALGVPFLGKWGIDTSHRVAIFSGESGLWALQDTALRICQSKGVDLRDLEDKLIWSDFVPKIANDTHLASVERLLDESGERCFSSIRPTRRCLGATLAS